MRKKDDKCGGKLSSKKIGLDVRRTQTLEEEEVTSTEWKRLSGDKNERNKIQLLLVYPVK